MAFHENICILTGKVVPYLAQMDCFVPKVEQNTRISTQNANRMAENATTKVCKVCGRELPIDQFRPNYKSKDGHLDTCYECLNKKIKETNKRKENELLEKISGQDEVDKAESPSLMKEIKDKMNACLERSVKNLSSATDQELVDELRARGWAVTCSRTIEL